MIKKINLKIKKLKYYQPYFKIIMKLVMSIFTELKLDYNPWFMLYIYIYI